MNGRAWVAHFRSTPFLTLLALMKAPLRAKKKAAMVRFTLDPRLIAAFTCNQKEFVLERCVSGWNLFVKGDILSL